MTSIREKQEGPAPARASRPIIAAIDESYSITEGDKQDRTNALARKIFRAARDLGRDLITIHFSNKSRSEFSVAGEFTEEDADPGLSRFAGPGTDYTRMLQQICAIMKGGKFNGTDVKFEGADLIVITDGRADVPDSLIPYWHNVSSALNITSGVILIDRPLEKEALRLARLFGSFFETTGTKSDENALRAIVERIIVTFETIRGGISYQALRAIVERIAPAPLPSHRCDTPVTNPVRQEAPSRDVYEPSIVWIRSLTPCGPPEDPALKMTGTLDIQGRSFHAEAYEVIEAGGKQKGKQPEEETHLAQTLEIIGGTAQTLNLGGREYVLIIIPLRV